MVLPVVLNQTRFNTPGLVPDARGVVVGKLGAVLLSSMDRLVGFFRLFCSESPIDDILPGLKIHEVRSAVGSREILVLFGASSSYLCDRAARIAVSLSAIMLTGSGKHFVRYRDPKSPLGYDVDSLNNDPVDFVVYAGAFTQTYGRVRDLSLEQIVLRLQLQSLPRESELDGVVWIGARVGIGRALIQYLWRNGVRVDAALASPTGGALASGPAMYLCRVSELPPRMVRLFSTVPGVELFRPMGDNVLVQYGFRHPLQLESCASLFEKERFYIFSGSRSTVDRLGAAPVLVSGDILIGSGIKLLAQAAPTALTGSAPSQFEVDLKLVPAASAKRRVTATLVPWDQAGWLRRLVYALPPTVLAGSRVAAIVEGLFIVAENGLEMLPIGEMLQEAAPSIFVPVGYEFMPRVEPQVLTEHVGGVSGRMVVFRRGVAGALGIDRAALEALGRRALARVEVTTRERDARMSAPLSDTPSTVVNEDAGVFPLWSWKTELGGGS